MIAKYEFDSGVNGTHLLILSAVHGNETAGTQACHRFLDMMEKGKISLKKGKLVLVPICNPRAYQRDVRQIDENLNRVMIEHAVPKTYEQQLANEICPLIKECDVMLDLHSTHCMGDVPFAFCDYPDKRTLKLIKALSVDYVLEGWPDIYAGSEIKDFSTECCAHTYGKAGTTVECGYHKSSEAVELAYSAILSTLSAFEMIDGVDLPKNKAKTHILMNSYVIKRRAGKLCKNYKHLDTIKKGEIIAQYDDGEILKAPNDGFILLPNLNAEVGAEWYYLGTAKL